MDFKKGKTLFLLMVEKDPDYIHLIRKSLEDNSHYTFRVDQVHHLDDAVKKLRENHYHLLLVQNKLENARGLDLLKVIQGQQLHIPFVLMTDVPDESLAREAFKQGAAELIVKSESRFPELASKLEASYERYADKGPYFASMDVLEKLTPERRQGPAGRAEDKRHQHVEETRHRDGLTGIYNHSYLHERLVQEFAAASRYHYSLSCIFIDTDRFSKINEKHGFQAGDMVIKKCAELLFQNCRMSDIIARYGGEEFVILLPHTGYEGALNLALRLHQLFSEHKFVCGDSFASLSVSMGISSYPEDLMQKRFELLSFATQATLRCKVAGGNRVMRYKDIAPVLGDDVLRLKLSEDKINSFRQRITEISQSAQRACLEASKTLISALENKDKLTAGHSANTASYARETALLLGLSEEEAEVIYNAALLHDIGKLCIPDEILMKRSKLTFQEYEMMKQHPYLGHQILKPIKLLQQEALIVLHHHEWFNGRGYPKGVQGKQIPIGARIVAVLDAFDTLCATGARYKDIVSVPESVNEIIACAGTQFDPLVVRVFVQILQKQGQLSGDFNQQELENKVKTLSAAA